MTIILSDNNSRIFTANPLEGGGGGNCPKLLSLYFLGKSDDNKNVIFQNAVLPVLYPDHKISRWVPCRPFSRTPCRPPLLTRPLKNYFIVISASLNLYWTGCKKTLKEMARFARACS